MNRILLVALLIIAISCKPKEVIITNSQVKEVVEYLASDNIEGRDAGSDGIEQSATFIENIFKELNVKPYYDTYRDHFRIDSISAFNVIGFIEGNDKKLKNEIVLIGAHYDHVGKGQAQRNRRITDIDSIANGANDNASGTSAVLAFARALSVKKRNKRSVMFVLFSAEELGLLGSQHLAERLKSENVNLYTMINFEMIGVPLINKDHMAFVSGYEKSNMADIINKYVGENVIGFSEIAKKYNLFKASDNYPFYQVFNVPCQTIASCDLSNYEYYHHVDDEVEELDFNFATELINKLIPAIESILNSPTQEIKLYDGE